MNALTEAAAVSEEEYNRTVRRVSVISMIGNLCLAAFKFFAGIAGKSSAMISDAVHSSSDIVGSFIVLVGAKLSGKEADKGHPYGHERFESIASILLAFILFLAGFNLIRDGLKKIISGSYTGAPSPGLIALAAAIISIVVKEAMYWFTILQSRRINSDSLKAEAWHHRSDALSSIGSLIGIAGARMGFPVLDPLAGILISLFILKAALDIFLQTIDKLTDHACSPELEERIRTCVESCSDVKKIDLLRTREFGRRVYVDLEISMDGSIPLSQAHETAEQVHDLLEKSFPQLKHVMVHVNPYRQNSKGQSDQ